MKEFSYRRTYSSLVGLVVGLLYGVIARVVFAYEKFAAFFAIMTVAFIFLVPVALGALTVHFGEKERKRGWIYWILMPWVPCLILLLAILLIGWEGWICVLMALPVFFFMSSLGGVVAGLSARAIRSEKNSYSVLIVLALLPFLTSPVEQRFRAPDSLRSVETEILINAPLGTVWENIERVRKIEPSEQEFSFFHLMGFPQPVEATLSNEAVGGVRHATFEGGVLFVETIDKWERDKELRFSIKADTPSIPPTTLDEHVTIGGTYFDMLEGDYRLEPLNDRQVMLHLSSKHRLSTRFNFYAGLWTDFIMRDIQKNILKIIKKRAEQVR